MNGYNSIVATAMLLMLSGCMTVEGPDHKYVLTKEGFKEVQTAKQASSETVSTGSKSKPLQMTNPNLDPVRGVCYRYGHTRNPVPWTTFEFFINRDVDVVYPIVMREFGYIKYKAPLNYGTNIPVCEIENLYDEVPGSHYQMRKYLSHSYGSERKMNTIEVDLSKDAKDRVRVRVSYYSGDIGDDQGYEASLKNRILRATR
jgi:hypothetical protein